MTIEVCISVSRREVILTNIPREIPSRGDRRAIHELIDNALDGLVPLGGTEEHIPSP